MSAARPKEKAAGHGIAGPSALPPKDGAYSPGSPILAAEALAAGYPGSPPILRGLSLGLVPGSVLALIGPNGAGKTTLFRVLSGELAPGSGRVSFFARDEGRWLQVRDLSPRRRALRIGRVLQSERPAWPVAVADYVEAGLFAREGWFGPQTGGARALVEKALEEMGIGDLAGRPVTELSGGEFRRVVIARALAQDPEVLLLDEPTADLDMAHQLETLSALRDLAAAGKAVAFSVHDLNQAAMAADEVALLAKGRIAALGAPAAVLTAEIIGKAYGANVIVAEHPAGEIPHVILDPSWLHVGGEDRGK